MESVGVDRIMSRPAVTVGLGASLAAAARSMLENRVGCVLVVDDEGRLRGIVTDSDFCARRVGVPFSTFRHPQVLGRWLGRKGVEPAFREARSRGVAEVMSSPVFAVKEGDSVEDVLTLMMRRGVEHVPVLRGDRPVGVVTSHDLLKLLLDALDAGRAPSPKGGGRPTILREETNGRVGRG